MSGPDSTAAGGDPRTPLAPVAGGVRSCPLINSPVVLDGLLAELRHSDRHALDLALDLRSALQRRADAGACVTLLCRLREQLDGRHYLAFFRVRRWLQTLIATETRPHRAAAWQRTSLPLDYARPEEACYQCLARLHPAGEHLPALAQVRFVFTDVGVPRAASDARA